MSKQTMICIVCPRGCQITVDSSNDYEVTGHACPRGVVYGRNEVLSPSRTLTSTVSLRHAAIPRAPVKSLGNLPKGLIEAAMRELAKIRLDAPVTRGQVVVADILGSGIDIVVTRDIGSLNDS